MNEWIRANDDLDAVIDFDEVLRHSRDCASWSSSTAVPLGAPIELTLRFEAWPSFVGVEEDYRVFGAVRAGDRLSCLPLARRHGRVVVGFPHQILVDRDLIKPPYDCDGIHPNVFGYAAMGRSIDLTVFDEGS